MTRSVEIEDLPAWRVTRDCLQFHVCAQLGEHLLVSDAVAQQLSGLLTTRDVHSLKGASGPIEVFGLPPDKVFEASRAPEAIPAPAFSGLSKQPE